MLSSSPEEFLSVTDEGRLRTSPIKGTRPRGSTIAEDQEFKADLLESRKERAENVDADRAAMLPISIYLGWCNSIRLGRDYYVRLDTNDYSEDPTVIGRMVDVSADLERLKVRADGRIVADHARVWARGATVTDPAHVETAARLRKQFQQPRAVAIGDDLIRDLADYDRAFGLVTGDGNS